MHRTFALLVGLSGCFSEPETLALAAESSSEDDGTFSPSDPSSTATMGSTSVATSTSAGSASGSASSSASESSSDEDSDSTSTSEGSSSSSESGSESSTGEVVDPYRPCWPGPPMGGSQCDRGEFGSLCVADDDPEQTSYACSSACELAADCPAPTSGAAVPHCIDIGMTGVCILDCAIDEDCPTGMICTVFATGALDPWPAACMWPWGWWQ